MRTVMHVMILSFCLCASAIAQVRYRAEGPVVPIDEVGVIFAQKQNQLVADLILPEHMMPKGYKAQGIEKNDLLVMMNGKDIHTVKEAEDLYKETKIGETIKIGLKRGEEKMLVSFLKANPDDLPKRKIIKKTDGPNGEHEDSHD